MAEEEPSSPPSSPLEFDWDAIDAELGGPEDGGGNGGTDSIPLVNPDLTSQDPIDGPFQRGPHLQNNRNAERAGYHSDEERPRPYRSGSMAVFKDVVKDTIENIVPDRQRIYPSDPAKKFSASADVEKFSALRIKDRTASFSGVHSRLSDLRFVRLQAIKNTDKLAGTWATIGVVVSKGMPKQTVKGKSFAVWKLSTLEKASLSLFLFGSAYTEHWKEPPGAVVTVFNASVRPDTKSAEFCLSVFNSDQVVKLGTSADYSVCQGRRKDGTPCTMVMNKRSSQGQFCQYHARAARDEFRSSRPELSGGKLVNPNMRRGYRPKPAQIPVANEVFNGPLKLSTTSDLKKLLSDTEKLPTKAHSQGKRFLEVMSERTSDFKKVIAKKGEQCQKSQEEPASRKRTPLGEKQVNSQEPGLRKVDSSFTAGGKSKSKGAVMEIDMLDDLDDSMMEAALIFKKSGCT